MIRAPFPYAGGKRLIAPAVWDALGDCRVYVEPFFGSGAVLLNRPHEPAIETINDRDGLLCNVWRAIKLRPLEVAEHADYPVSELDLFARHQWLVHHRESLSAQLRADPEWCDPKSAGWWIWGASQWIGGGWCTPRESQWQRRPTTSHADHGVHIKRPMIAGSNSGKGVCSKLPNLSSGGTGVKRQIPRIHGFGGTGVHGHALTGESLQPWFEALSERLRRVRIVSGDFLRVLSPSTLAVEGTNVCGVFLDPPYSHDLRSAKIYAHDDATASARARVWAIGHGDDPSLRIVLAGLAGEHEMPPSWRVVEWTGPAGMGRKSGNRHKERLWLSPHCREIGDGPLFSQEVTA